MHKLKPRNTKNALIALMKEGIGKIDHLTEMAQKGGRKADRLIADAREIKNLLLGLEADGMPKVNLKGVRRDQFFAAVDCQRKNRWLSPWKCALTACAEIKPTAENGGYDEDGLYRYMRSKPEYFRWTSGKNAGKNPKK